MSARLAEVVRVLAKRRGGFRTTDPQLEPFGPPAQIGRNMSYLVKSGAIVSVRLTSRSAIYFGRREDADEWISKHNHETWAPSYKGGRFAELKTNYDTRPSGEVVMAPGVKITICPGFEPRFQPVSVPGAPRSFYGAAGRCGVEAVAR